MSIPAIAHFGAPYFAAEATNSPRPTAGTRRVTGSMATDGLEQPSVIYDYRKVIRESGRAIPVVTRQEGELIAARTNDLVFSSRNCPINRAFKPAVALFGCNRFRKTVTPQRLWLNADG